MGERIKSPEISIIVPVHNEAGNIAPLIEAIRHAFKKRTIEIIYVDDASTDATREELKAMLAKEPSLRMLTHSIRCGQSQALRSGIMAAQSDLIATLDGDGQNPPSDLLALEKAVRAHPSTHVLAAGVRAKRQDSLSKRFGSVFARKVRLLLLRDNHPDTGCATRVFPKELYLRLPYFNHMHRFMPSLAKREGYEVIALPVNHMARQRGSSKYSNLNRFWVSIADILGMIWLRRRSPKAVKVKDSDG